MLKLTTTSTLKTPKAAGSGASARNRYAIPPVENATAEYRSSVRTNCRASSPGKRHRKGAARTSGRVKTPNTIRFNPETGHIASRISGIFASGESIAGPSTSNPSNVTRKTALSGCIAINAAT